MNEDLKNQQSEQEQFNNELEQVLRKGAQQLLQQAIEAEVADYIAHHADHTDEQGHRLVIRNGHLPERNIQTGLGLIKAQQPRVRDKREGKRFCSSILPRYARRTPSLEAVIPTLYLKGISTGDFGEALEALLDKGAQGLSATTIVRLKRIWEEEYDE